MKKVFFILIATTALFICNYSQAAEKDTDAVSNNAHIATVKTTETDKTMNGTVCDKQTAETLAGAVITLNGEKIYTDFDGHFQLKNIKGKCQLKISMISYEEQIINIDEQNFHPLKIELKQL